MTKAAACKVINARYAVGSSKRGLLLAIANKSFRFAKGGTILKMANIHPVEITASQLQAIANLTKTSLYWAIAELEAAGVIIVNEMDGTFAIDEAVLLKVPLLETVKHKRKVRRRAQTAARVRKYRERQYEETTQRATQKVTDEVYDAVYKKLGDDLKGTGETTKAHKRQSKSGKRR